MSYTKVVDKQGPNTSYKGTWVNLGGGTLSGTGIEDASNINLGAATFGNVSGSGKPIADKLGAGAVIVRDGTNFQYDKRLDAAFLPSEDLVNGFGSIPGGIYDTGVSGALAANKVFRIVQNGTNVNNPAGLALKVYAKNTSGNQNSLVSPPKDQVYVNPVNGSFVLPRPVYFGTMDSASGIIYPTLQYENYVPSYTATGISGFNTGKFGNCFYHSPETWFITRYAYIYPFSVSGPTLQRGTLSTWFKLYSPVLAQAILSFYINSSTYINISNLGGISTVDIYVNGVSRSSVSVALDSFTFYNLYICWDGSGGLTGSKTISVFINNVSAGSATTLFTATTPYIRSTTYGTGFGQGVSYVDHLKIWNHVVDESAAWDYNSGTGSQNGLHSIYPAANGYIPILDSTSTPDSGVGYLYLTTSSNTSTISTGSAAESVTLADAGYISNCNGYFGTGGPLANSTPTKLAVDTSYAFEKRIDASNIEDATDGFGIVTGGIWDTGISGALATGKYLRVVQNGKNLKTAVGSGGLGLKIFAKNLGKFVAPPEDRCYVDPALGRFVLPGPSFWSKTTDDVSIETPEIYEETPVVTTNATSINKTFTTGKFGNCLSIGNARTQRYYNLAPFGTYAVEDTGTFSAWQYFGTGCSSEVHFGGDNNYVRINHTTVSLYISGVLAAETSTGIVSAGVFNHIYILWNKNAAIDNGKYVKVFINNSERVSALSTWVSDYFYIKLIAEETTEAVCTDNLKIWKHVVSGSASWDYNSGTGYSDSMHSIYGATLSYKPDFTSSTSSGVGYHRNHYDVDYMTITI